MLKKTLVSIIQTLPSLQHFNILLGLRSATAHHNETRLPLSVSNDANFGEAPYLINVNGQTAYNGSKTRLSRNCFLPREEIVRSFLTAARKSPTQGHPRAGGSPAGDAGGAAAPPIVWTLVWPFLP